VTVDAGALRKLMSGGASLLPVGMTSVMKNFERGSAVSILKPDGSEFAHGISNYDSDDLKRLCGVKSDRISEILGYSYGDAVIHRNNLVLLT
jgi:glutamate 5-kinase